MKATSMKKKFGLLIGLLALVTSHVWAEDSETWYVSITNNSDHDINVQPNNGRAGNWQVSWIDPQTESQYQVAYIKSGTTKQLVTSQYFGDADTTSWMEISIDNNARVLSLNSYVSPASCEFGCWERDLSINSGPVLAKKQIVDGPGNNFDDLYSKPVYTSIIYSDANNSNQVSASIVQ